MQFEVIEEICMFDRYIIEIPDFATIVVVHGVQNSVPSTLIGNGEWRPFIIAMNVFNNQQCAKNQLRSVDCFFTRTKTPGAR